MAKSGPKYTAQVVWVTTPELAGELRYWAEREGQRMSAFLRWVVRAGLTRTRKALHDKHGQPLWREVEAYAQSSKRPSGRHAQLGWMDEPDFVGELRYWAWRENVSLSELLAKVAQAGFPSTRARLVRKHGEPAEDKFQAHALRTFIDASVSQNRWARFRRGVGPDPRLDAANVTAGADGAAADAAIDVVASTARAS